MTERHPDPDDPFVNRKGQRATTHRCPDCWASDAWGGHDESWCYVCGSKSPPVLAYLYPSREAEELREAFVELFPSEDGFTELMDELIRLGLLVEVPADDAFKEWWDPDAETMYVWRWSDLARNARSP